jgi:hypothetical protein
MKRDEIKSVLENEELDTSAKIDAILNMRKDAVAREERRYNELQQRYDTDTETFNNRADYDAIREERDALLAEKADREFSERFLKVVGGKQFVNSYTADGVKRAFTEALALPDNKGKTDAEIYKTIADGNEAAWFKSSVTLNMTPSAGGIDTADETRAYLDAKYANNPFYKQ